MSSIQRVFIVGQPGAGKGVLAQILAKKLNWQFVDADLGIESQVGLTLHEILGKQGLDSYSECQFKILEALTNRQAIVVATDGLVLGNDKCMSLLSNEFVVHIKINSSTQIEERTAAGPKTLLSFDNYGNLLDKLHTERDSKYESVASYSFSRDDNALDEHVQSIVEILDDKKNSG
jgi:shikimate kinase